ncbi:MBL fold metallo-hydrolase [Ramlibacter ginsenosidimutans]|uniref:MBL fold metallo-hydrolase n=1 Tax=Ramlibacter ginsenosidimutans TaxID=502333 RepID=A0A934TP09_9BURK|nr:MBL fold metallo-hydrolase [Ramlibacter ginsenosidimutans]MBK6004749.1 MBL fold metallo-hydrolase [Ramlibacter ginsenosidimutans]
MITDATSRTNIHEIADGIYRINTPIDLPNGAGFSFNQYLLVDDEPLLFHTGPRKLFGAVRDAMAAVMPVRRLRYVGFSHFEADECGSLNEWLAIAPEAVPLCGRVGALISITDVADRPPRVLADGEQLPVGRHTLRWMDTPQVPHGWDCGLLMDSLTGTFFCGDLFTQPGHGDQPLTEGDILGPSEGFRQAMDYFAHAPQTPATIERLADLQPRTLACMHGSAWRGDGAALLRQLAHALAGKE